MSVPFYKRTDGVTHPNAPHQHANTGLWFTRFYKEFDQEWQVGDEGKRGWIQTVTGAKGNQQVLELAASNLANLGKALEAEICDFKTEWNFATGLGLSHPVENGFAWHHTLGVPYLAASGVKGMLRAWVEAWMDHESDAARNQLVNRWFGAAKADKGQEESVGGLIFFDALPTGPVSLACDVMTPHMGGWYEKGGEIRSEADYADKAPADWHSPVPVPFLVVNKKTSFRFMIAPRLTGEQNAQARQDAKEAMAQLELALEWMGAGAKTAAGYGRMLREKPAEEVMADELTKAGIQIGTEQWLNAKAVWDKGKSALSIVATEGKVTILGAEAKQHFDKLSEAGQKRLKDGKKPLLVNASVVVTGNRTQLLSIEEVQAS